MGAVTGQDIAPVPGFSGLTMGFRGVPHGPGPESVTDV